MAASALVVIGISGCTSGAVSSPAPSTLPGLPTAPATTTIGKPAAPTPEAADYRSLLLWAADLSDAEDTFNERSRDAEPNGSPGASAFFVNDEDNRAISDTVLVYPDAETATATLQQAAGTLPTLVVGGTPTPIAVGTDGVVTAGTDPEANKSVTLLLFTEGRALVRLEFQSAAGNPTTDQFVYNVGKMQQIALRVGLADSE